MELTMTKAEATAAVFLTAFRALPKRERDAVLAGMVEDQELREDLIDLGVFQQRRKEPSRSFREYLSEKEK
jgi:hypothetical protein